MKLPICGRAIFSGKETPIFELYILKYPMDNTFQVGTARSVFARRAQKLYSKEVADRLQPCTYRAPP